MNDIELELAKAVEPLMDEIISVSKRLDSLARQPGPPGEGVKLDDVIASLKADPAFLQAVTGPAGNDVPAELVVEKLKGDPELIEKLKAPPLSLAEVINDLVEVHGEQLRGKEGQAPSAEDVANKLFDNPAFVEVVSGKPGLNGSDGAGIKAPPYVPKTVYREGSIVSAYLGQYYHAKRDTVGQPGNSDDWERLGAGGFRWCKFKPDVLSEGDIYIDGGSLFCVVEGKGQMWVQRPKAAPYLKEIGLHNGELQATLSNGEIIRCSLDELATPSVNQQQQIELTAALEELRLLKSQIADLTRTVVELVELAGGES